MTRLRDKDGDELVEITYQYIEATTDLAWLMEFNDTDDEDSKLEWLPKSECDIIDADECILQIPKWLLIEKELECYLND